jgi:hypothetical protein
MKNLNLSGTWNITQQWGNNPAYSFKAVFSPNGTLSIEKGKYFGTYAVLGSSNQISLAIADFKGQTITTYIGNVVGDVMGGIAEGAHNGSTKGTAGTWSAFNEKFINAEEKSFHLEEESVTA